MASKTQKTEAVRARKHRPNRVNIKTDQKRLDDSLEVLKKVTDAK
jgi:hypothetical protein